MYLSLTEAAALLGVTRQRVHQLIQRGELHTGRLGHALMLSRDEVEQYKARREAQLAAKKEAAATRT